MKKVLIITYHFPPKPGVAAIRPFGLAKYLPENGWEPIILTSRFPNRPPMPFRVLETPAGKFGWRVRGLQAARKIIEEAKIEAVVSVYRPAAGHLMAAALKKEFPGLCWAADFRDLWTQNHTYRRRGLRRFLDRKKEMRTLRNADALTTVSGPWAQKLQDLHHKPAFAIPNGFDPAEWSAEPLQPTGRFVISYTGGIYFGEKAQDVIPFLNALRSLVAEESIKENEMEVNFYGDRKDRLEAAVKERNLERMVVQHGVVPRSEVLEKQRQSQLLLLLDWNDPAESGVCPGKLYEYFAARRPVLSAGGHPGVVQNLLRETKAGFCCETEPEIKDVLRKCYREFKQKGMVDWPGDEEAVMRYSHQAMAKKFAEILDHKK